MRSGISNHLQEECSGNWNSSAKASWVTSLFVHIVTMSVAGRREQQGKKTWIENSQGQTFGKGLRPRYKLWGSS